MALDGCVSFLFFLSTRLSDRSFVVISAFSSDAEAEAILEEQLANEGMRVENAGEGEKLEDGEKRGAAHLLEPSTLGAVEEIWESCYGELYTIWFSCLVS